MEAMTSTMNPIHLQPISLPSQPQEMGMLLLPPISSLLSNLDFSNSQNNRMSSEPTAFWNNENDRIIPSISSIPRISNLSNVPICKTSLHCKTKVKIINGKICLKRKTVFKTVMDLSSENNHQQDCRNGDGPNERHITSICFQYYEVPLPESINTNTITNNNKESEP